jgi:hypothetical protein
MRGYAHRRRGVLLPGVPTCRTMLCFGQYNGTSTGGNVIAALDWPTD